MTTIDAAHTEPTTMRIVCTPATTPPGKLADAALRFESGPLAGLKLVGFAVWEHRAGGGRTVTFPARTYSVNGERRSYALLRPVVDMAGSDRLRDAILAAYAEYDETTPC